MQIALSKNDNTVPKTFYIHTWTESKRKAHAERTLSEGRAHGEWTNGERKLNGIGWVGVNGERMQNAKVAQTGTQGEPWMHDVCSDYLGGYPVTLIQTRIHTEILSFVFYKRLQKQASSKCSAVFQQLPELAIFQIFLLHCSLGAHINIVP